MLEDATRRWGDGIEGSAYKAWGEKQERRNGPPKTSPAIAPPFELVRLLDDSDLCAGRERGRALDEGHIHLAIRRATANVST